MMAASIAIIALQSITVPAIGIAQSPNPATATDPAYFQSYHAAARDTVSPTVYQGWKQFELNCARCHGDFGVGTSFAPALVESVKPTGTIPTAELFLQTVCAGRLDKGMPAWCALGLEMGTIQEIYAYLQIRSTGKVGIGRPAERGE
jgi:mono/diheme cytochrome c family protein